MNATVIEHVPTLAIRYLERARELGIDLSGIKVAGDGESLSQSYKRKIEARYGITFLPEVYAGVELRTAAFQCEEHNGLHIYEDHIIEIIDPETGQVLDAGQEGEIVATSLVTDCTPMIRWRPGDIASLLPYEPCPCGRTLPRMSYPVKGKLAFAVKVKGKRIFPIDVEEVLAKIPDLGDEFQMIRQKPQEQEILKVKAEHIPEAKDLHALKARVEDALGQELKVDAEVELVPIGSIGRALFKAQRVINAF